MFLSKSGYRYSYRAFTLTELLVVLAILATLLALISPVLFRARDRARVTSCASNMGQLYQAFAMYAQDNDGKLPPYQNVAGRSWGCNDASCGGKWRINVPAQGKELTAALRPYTKSNDLWFCPADYLARTDAEDAGISHRYTSYKASPWLGKQAFPQFATIVTLEGVTEKGVPSRFGTGTALLHENLWPYDSNLNVVKPLYSHAGIVHSLYLDGHIKSNKWDTSETRLTEGR